MDVEKICNKLDEIIDDEQKGIDEYDSLLEELNNTSPFTQSIESIQEDEKRHRNALIIMSKSLNCKTYR